MSRGVGEEVNASIWVEYVECFEETCVERGVFKVLAEEVGND